MIVNITLCLLSIFSIYYVYFIVRVRLGLRLLRIAPLAKNLSKVSVIVAARNEEKIIGKCLQSLLHQTYPLNKYEIIIVDDGSTDKTASIVKSFSKQYSNVCHIQLPIRDKQEGGSKPFAITQGIKQADGEIILTTDADCVVSPRWVEVITNYFENDTVFVAGPVVESSTKSFFSHLEQLELLGLITTAAGLIGSGRPIICNGANLAYRKNAFYSVNGFGANGNSNDDELLMNRINYRNIGKVTFAPELDAVVTTSSSNTIKSFLFQRIRWANKRGHYEDKSILITLVSLYFFFLSMVLLSLLVPQKPQLVFPLALVFMIKLFVDYSTLSAGARLFKQHFSIFHFIVAELFHVPYIVIAAAIGQLSTIKWKERIIN